MSIPHTDEPGSAGPQGAPRAPESSSSLAAPPSESFEGPVRPPNNLLARRALRVALPLLVLALGVWGSSRVLASKPQPKRKSSGPTVMDVQVASPQRGSHRVLLRSQGTVSSPSRTTLVAQVAGRVVEVAPEFEAGAFVSSGTVLVQLDDSDYVMEIRDQSQQVALADANLGELVRERESAQTQATHARERLAIEQDELKRLVSLEGKGVSSRSALAQARRDELAARTTLATQENRLRTLDARRQVLLAQKALASTRLAKARLDRSRTKIRAPFEGRVLSRTIGLGQFLSPGAELGALHDLLRVEIRLPLSRTQLEQLPLPDGRSEAAREPFARVRLRARQGDEFLPWEAWLVRSEGRVDPASRQVFVVAEVKLPFGTAEAPAPSLLRIGSFVSAEIEGRELQDVFVIPRVASQRPGELLVVGKDDVLRRRQVEVVWRDSDSIVVSKGLEPGERVCLTPVVFAGESVKVRVQAASAKSSGQPGDAP